MTSPSRTKPRTTRRGSTREPGRRPAARGSAAAIALMLAVALPAQAGWRDLQQGELPRPARLADVTIDGPAEPAATDADIAPSADITVVGAEADEDEGMVVATAAAGDVEGAASPGEEAASDCREALERLRSDAIAEIDLDIRVGGRPGDDYPLECRLEGGTFAPRRFATTTFTWKAAGYCHKPLYFEHWNLERYGHSHGFVADSFLSAAHFFGRLPALPYQMGVELPWECVYPLGYYRPGSCAPWTVPAVPISARGLAVGAATATGVVFLLP